MDAVGIPKIPFLNKGYVDFLFEGIMPERIGHKAAMRGNDKRFPEFLRIIGAQGRCRKENRSDVDQVELGDIFSQSFVQPERILPWAKSDREIINFDAVDGDGFVRRNIEIIGAVDIGRVHGNFASLFYQPLVQFMDNFNRAAIPVGGQICRSDV